MISITCPYGFGETDRTRCINRMACLLPPMVCMLCPIPVILIAGDGRSNINRHVAARLPGLISSHWTPPKRPKVKKRRSHHQPAPWIQATAPVAKRAALAMDLPCTVHRFYQTMRRLGAPKLAPWGRRMVIQAAGLTVVTKGGIERVLGEVEA